MQTMLRDGRSNLRDVGMENIVDIAGKHEQGVALGATGKGIDQAEQVLVRAEAADVEEDIARRSGCRSVASWLRRARRGTWDKRSGRGLR